MRWGAALLVAWQIAAPADLQIVRTPDEAGMASVILVVGNSGALSSGDTSIQTRLTTDLGHTVTVKDDGDAEVGSGFDAVVVAESVNSVTFGTKYKTSAKGVLLLEIGSFDDFDMSGAGTAQNITTLHVDSVGDLSAGLSGTVTYYSAAAQIYRVADSGLGAGVTIVTRASSGSSQIFEFAYESGAALVSGNAAGRRVAIPIPDVSVASLATDGWALFDAAVTWAIGAGGGGGAATWPGWVGRGWF